MLSIIANKIPSFYKISMAKIFNNQFIHIFVKKVSGMQKIFSIKKRIYSFAFAINGIRYAILSQHNIIIHIILTIVAVIFGFLLKINNLEWISIVIVIGMVMTAELFNTSIEEIVNYISPERNNMAGRIKDLAAGAVLISAIAAFIVGTIIFLPKIYDLL